MIDDGKALRRRLKWAGLFLPSVLLIAVFQNCQQKSFKVYSPTESPVAAIDLSSQGPQQSSSSSTDNTSNTAVTPISQTSTPTASLSCREDSNFNACVVWKNMVAQNGGSLTPTPSFGLEQTSRLSYGVNLPGLDSSGYLQNSTITVNITNGTRVTKNSDGNWKHPYLANDSQHFPAQINAYYWVMQLQAHQESVGGFYARNKDVSVDAFRSSSTGSYFSFIDNQLVMGNYSFDFGSGGQEGAMFGEVVIHEMGHGNLYWASGVNTYNANLVKKMDPAGASSTGNLACTTASGCFPSISEAVADLQYLFIFPTSPGFHNVVAAKLDGIQEFGLTRNPEVIGTMTAQAIYDWPKKIGYSKYAGSVHLLSRAYTAAWWAVWKRAKLSAKEKDIEQIFNEHLSKLTGSSTFKTALSSILTIDQTFFSNQYSAIFIDEFAIRGINP